MTNVDVKDGQQQLKKKPRKNGDHVEIIEDTQTDEVDEKDNVYAPSMQFETNMVDDPLGMGAAKKKKKKKKKISKRAEDGEDEELLTSQAN